MACINVRGAFQIYKAEKPEATVQDFNSLTPEVLLPYKILASEEILAASLDLVESQEEYKATYAVSTLHSAYVYLNQLASYVPLMSRSQNAKKLAINTVLLVKIAVLYGGGDGTFLELVRKLISDADPFSDNVSVTDLSNLERAMSELEKKFRQEVKSSGGKVEMLRKVVVAAPTASAKGSTPALPAGSNDDGAVCEEGDVEGSASGRRRSRLSSAPSASQTAEEAGDGEQPLSKGPRAEGSSLAESPTDAVPAPAEVGAALPPRPKRAVGRVKPQATLVFGRLRGLTNGEKKAVALLNQVIDVLAHVYANRYNNLIPIFDSLDERVKAVQSVIDGERAAYEAKEDKKPPEPFHETTLDGVVAALAKSTQAFRDDEECRYELDEDLLHPIAHACLTVINQIEGYTTVPYVEPTEEDLMKKQAARDQLRVKREEAARKVLERAKAREELALKKEEEKRLLRLRLGGTIDEDDLQDDAEIKNPVPMGYVHYEKNLPLGSVELFEKAVFLWSMLVSVPQPLMLSQMPFSIFVKGLLEEDQDANGLMEEITGCLLDLTIEHVRASSPGTPRITTRGKNWFDALVEFVGIASGNKKKRQQQQRRPPSTPTSTSSSSSEDDLGSDDDLSSDTDSSSSSSSSSASSASATEEEVKDPGSEAANADGDANPPAAEGGSVTVGAGEAKDDSAAPKTEAEEEEDTDSFSAELKATVERVTALRSLATWGNVDLVDRLNLLQFCVLEALACDKVVDEADKLFKEREEDAAELEKHIKEVREEAEKEMRGVLKGLSGHVSSPTAAGATAMSSSPNSSPTSKAEKKFEANQESYEEKKAQILASADAKRKAAYERFFSKQDGQDIGALIQPIGMDRYKRLYWRFPLERRIWVQTTPSTADDFPLVPEPEELRKQRMGNSLFLDDEQEEEVMLLDSNRRKVGKAAEGKSKKHIEAEEEGEETKASETTQHVWGVVPGSYIATFAEGLDPRGEREAELRKALKEMADYVANMEEPHEGRATRSRARTFGYLNKLKSYF